MQGRRVVAIAIVGILAGLPGCADDSGGPRVAPPPDPALTAGGPAKAGGAPAGRTTKGVSTRPEVRADALKTTMP